MVWLDVDPSSDYSIHGQQWPLSSDSPANSAQELSAGGEPVSEYTVAAAASGSEATIAWTDASPFYATSETARAIRWPIGGAPGTEATVSSANDVFGGVMAVGADAAGDSVIAWRGENPTTAVHAARWPQAASAPAAQQTVSGAGDTGVGNVSISVATGGAGTIVWRATGTSNASSPYVADAVLSPTGIVGAEHTVTPVQSADVDPGDRSGRVRVRRIRDDGGVLGDRSGPAAVWGQARE
jgi:hypothetical protein